MSWTYQSQALSSLGISASPVTVNKPSGVVSGDLLVSILYFQNTAGGQNVYGVFTNPSGWTTAGSDAQGFGNSHAGTGFAQSMHVSWKVAGASEPTSYSWIFTLGSGAAYIDAAILRFTPSAGTVAFDNSENNNGTGNTTLNFGTTAMPIDTSALVISASMNWDYNTGQGYSPLALTAVLSGWDGVFDALYSVTGSTTYPANEQVTVAGTTTWVTRATSFKITGGATTYPITRSIAQTQFPFLVGNKLWHWDDGTHWNDGSTWAGTLLTATPSVTQAQSVALLKQSRLSRGLSQAQTLALRQVLQVVRSISEATAVAFIRAPRLSRALTQAQTLSLVLQKVFLRTLTLTQAQLLSIVSQKVFLRTVSVVQAQALTLLKQPRLVRTLGQLQTLSLTVSSGTHNYPLTRSVSIASAPTLSYTVVLLPPAVGSALPSQPPSSGSSTSNYQDWPLLVINGTPAAIPPAGAASGDFPDNPALNITPTLPPPPGDAIGGP